MCTFYFQFICQYENADAVIDFIIIIGNLGNFFSLKFGNSKVVQYELERWFADFDKISVDSLLT